MRLPHRLVPAAAMALLIASAALPLAPAVAAAATDYSTNCPVNLRPQPDTAATSLAVIPLGSVVTTEATVAGSAWSATACPGAVSGATWYVVSAVNGTSVATLYGTDVVYAASGLFATGAYLEGIDVSHYQGTISWASVVAAGKRFAVMQATVGSTYLDATYAANHAGARATSLPVAAYHFAAPLTALGDAIAQADWFVQNAALQPGDLIPALDIEKNGGLSVPALQAWVGAWLDEVTLKLGVRPMLYTSPSFWKASMGNTTQFADAGYSVLWVAHWDVKQPSIPANNWEGAGWTFWQYSDCGSVAGISGCVDLDRFNGSSLAAVTINPVGQDPNGGTPQLPPVLSGITPPSGRAGDGDITIMIDGANFVPTSKALWNGTPLATTFVSPTTLTAVVPGALTAMPRAGSITVENDPLVGPSGPVPFTIGIGNVQLEVAPSTAVVAWGQPADLRIGTRNLGANQSVTLQRMQANETTWATVATMATDASGAATLRYTPPVNTQFRAVYAATDGTESASPPVRIVVRQLVLLRPTSLGRVKSAPLNSTTTFTATVRPTGPTLAAPAVTFQFWQLVGGTWRNVANRHVKTDASGRASTAWKFTARGQWYVRVVADPTVTNANSVQSPLERYSII